MSTTIKFVPRTHFNLKAYTPVWTTNQWIKMRELYKLLHGSNGKCTRYAQWVRRAIEKLSKAGEIEALTINPSSPETTNIVSPITAVYLLIYGPNAAYNRYLVEQISKACNIAIPRKPGMSRYEELFAIALTQTLEDISANAHNRIDFTLLQQVNTGKYIVDFLLTISDLFNGKKIETLIIEFDEDYHKSNYQQQIDQRRDKYHMQKGMRTIRVKIEDMHRWLGYTEQWKYPFDKTSYLIELAKTAIQRHKVTGKYFVSTLTARLALDDDDHIGFLPDIKRPLAYLARLLTDLGVSYSLTKMKHKGKHARVLLVDGNWSETLKLIPSTRYSADSSPVQITPQDKASSVIDDKLVSQSKSILNSKLSR
ncbi:hypothetical protein [Shewanella algae]|uniref:hypothetical protein n=2 Tax=Shewanella algae TaxID=38313 RepID=UPI001AAF034F|nr:hypothetical protein [Shewanella algae]MBO2581730.1 hypothetical protein [Shewanella algae]